MVVVEKDWKELVAEALPGTEAYDELSKLLPYDAETIKDLRFDYFEKNKDKTKADFDREVKEFCDRVRKEQGGKQGIVWTTKLVHTMLLIRGMLVLEGWKYT